MLKMHKLCTNRGSNRKLLLEFNQKSGTFLETWNKTIEMFICSCYIKTIEKIICSVIKQHTASKCTSFMHTAQFSGWVNGFTTFSGWFIFYIAFSSLLFLPCHNLHFQKHSVLIFCLDFSLKYSNMTQFQVSK